MIRRCAKCDSRELTKGSQKASIDVGRRTFDGDVRGWRCDACGEVYYDGGDLRHFEQLVGAWLAERGFDDGEEVRFLRRQLELRAADLAALLDVTPETVSHWETGKTMPDLRARQTLGALVLDKVAGVTTTRDRLAGLRKPPATRKVRIEVRPRRAAAG